ncbi:MAG: AAA family ATPase [Lachnospiraceae bacterium]|nr:AAA family ATPase [Lachnospiraceae bacterium]
MGFYLNSRAAYTLYESETRQPYFVDKTKMLKELFPYVAAGNKHICLTRPRRFGKTMAANMIASFFSRACDAKALFDRLSIAGEAEYDRYRNQYHVVHISFNDMPRNCKSYLQYIDRIETRLIKDIQREFPDVAVDDEDAAWDAFMTLYMEYPDIRFIFVLDEWDFIFHQDFVTETDKKSYLGFLRGLLKDRPYVQFAYMTGILPISKYSSGSELNMFAEYTMAKSRMFSGYFGFSDSEVDMLYARYCRNQKESRCVDREELRRWYDGYVTPSGVRIYNPRSVVLALGNNCLDNYWTSSGPYDEIFYYIKNNVDSVRDDLALMVSGTSVPLKLQMYAATSQKLKTKEEILSAMVVYGFLSYQNGAVSIPNKELMDQFSDMMMRESSLGYVYQLAKESERMLKATLAGDTDTMEQILELVHDTETPILAYNHETELSAVVNLAYLSARDIYRVEREEKAGKGFVDFIFYPELPMASDGIILELKVGHSPEEAIAQIKDKNYAVRFTKKTGAQSRIPERILLVGIGYDRNTKKHRCRVETLMPG